MSVRSFLYVSICLFLLITAYLLVLLVISLLVIKLSVCLFVSLFLFTSNGGFYLEVWIVDGKIRAKVSVIDDGVDEIEQRRHGLRALNIKKQTKQNKKRDKEKEKDAISPTKLCRGAQ